MVTKSQPGAAPGAKRTSTSTSLSGRKSSRSTEPKSANSVTCQRRQKSTSAWRGRSILAGMFASFPSYILRERQAAMPVVGPVGPAWPVPPHASMLASQVERYADERDPNGQVEEVEGARVVRAERILQEFDDQHKQHDLGQAVFEVVDALDEQEAGRKVRALGGLKFANEELVQAEGEDQQDGCDEGDVNGFDDSAEQRRAGCGPGPSRRRQIAIRSQIGQHIDGIHRGELEGCTS